MAQEFFFLWEVVKGEIRKKKNTDVARATWVPYYVLSYVVLTISESSPVHKCRT